MCDIHSFKGFEYKLAPQPRLKLVQGPQPPLPDPKDTVFSWNPQDSRVLATGTRVIPGVMQGVRPETDLVKSNDELTPVNGKYVFPDGDSRQAKAQAFAAVANTVQVFKSVFGDFKWAFDAPKLSVNGDAGKFLNAFYRRENAALTFYHYPDPVHGSNVFSGASNDIASHECGHALLDSVRPNYYKSVNPEPRAFHEGFGDCMAISMALMDERVIARVIAQTDGDLSKPNCAAMVAEELGAAVNNTEGKNVTGGDFLRDANNRFVYSDVSKLPEKGGPDQLGWDRHSLGRLWSGTYFDVVKAVVNQHKAEGMAPAEAIKTGNQEVLQRMAWTLKEAPEGDFTFKDMALAMLRAEDKNDGGKYTQLMRDCFIKRNILTAETQQPNGPSGESSLFQSQDSRHLFDPNGEPEEVKVQVGQDFGNFSGASVEVTYDPRTTTDSRQAVVERTRHSIETLIQSGKVRYNDPAYRMTFPKDYMNPKGEAYVAAVYWENGEMVIRSLNFSVCD